MAFDIIWSNEAEHSFNGVIDHLLYHWSQQEAHHFISRTDELINVIGNQPLLFKPYKNKTNIRHGNLHKGLSRTKIRDLQVPGLRPGWRSSHRVRNLNGPLNKKDGV